MVTVKNIYDFVDEIAPFEKACSWDNVGLIVGDMKDEVKGVLISLDLTKQVIEEAISKKANLIITHHPILFTPLRKITDDEIAFMLIKNNINLISAHTNLDIAKGGINDLLAEKFGLKNTEILDTKEGLGRIGFLDEEISCFDFAKLIKEKLNCQMVKVLNVNRKIIKVAVNSGSGSDAFEFALNNNCDVFVTAEIKQNILVEANNKGINLIDAGHFETENIVCEYLKDLFLQKFSNLKCETATSNKCLTEFI
jgi:dinuclear metal center YbgI/SA1388 family protein